jgi:excinuclease ABC subunit C
MVAEADSVEWEVTDSALEAIILESNLIRKHKPRYNAMGKDDKSFNHVVITKEQYPRVLIIRGRDLAQIGQGAMAGKLTKRDIGVVFGPFIRGGSLKEALRLIRKIFPFRDRCTPRVLPPPKPNTLNTNPSPLCFNAQIGLCPGVCSGAITAKDYRRNIEHIKQFFRGQKKQLVRELIRDMKVFARQKEFEKAGEVKRQLDAIAHIQDIALLKRGEFGNASDDRAVGCRIEAYDVAHTSGRDSVGVMVVVENGEAQKSEYRMFKLRSSTAGSDTSALSETLSRRFGHTEWAYPKLIVMDGSKAQVNVATKIMREVGLSEFGESGIFVVGVVKDIHHRPSSYIGDERLIAKHERDILLANSEAHRFALQYHRKLRGKKL